MRPLAVGLLAVLLAGCLGAGSPGGGPGQDDPSAGPDAGPSNGPTGRPSSNRPPSSTRPPSSSAGIPAGPGDPGPSSAPLVPNHPPWLEPLELVRPSFVVRPIDLYALGAEPTVVSDPDGNLLVHAPGCLVEGAGGCSDLSLRDPIVVESRDEGQTWFAHNRADGRLADRPPGPYSSEAHVAVAPDGTRYLLDLSHEYVETAGAVASTSAYGRFFRSWGPGQPWQLVADIPDLEGSFDRPWVGAGADGQVVLAWNGGDRSVLVSGDWGTTWSSHIDPCVCGLSSPPAWAPAGPQVYLGIGMTPEDSPATDVPGLAMNVRRGVAQSLDGGLTWAVSGGDNLQRRPVASTSLSNGGFIPSTAVTGDGTVVVAWWQYDGDPTGYGVVLGSSVWYSASSDGGATWTPAARVSQRANALFAWIVPGGGDRFAVAYYTTDTPGEPGRAYSAVWDVEVGVVQDARAGAGPAGTTVAAAAVHAGTVCPDGTGCVGNNRGTFLDFLTVTTLPDGRMVVAYSADPPNAGPAELVLGNVPGGATGVVRIAVQEAGTPLFETPPA